MLVYLACACVKEQELICGLLIVPELFHAGKETEKTSGIDDGLM